MHPSLPSLAALFAAVVLPTASPATIGPPCRADGQTLKSGAHTRLYRSGADVYGCWDQAERPVLLDHFSDPGPSELNFPRVAGRYAAYSTRGSAEGAGGSFTAVRLADLKTGKSTTFVPVATPLPDPPPFTANEGTVYSLVLSRFGRVAWIGRTGSPYEVHRGDLAHRDRLLDSGEDINPRSLVIRRGKLRWRRAGEAKAADFDGMRGDKPPIEDPDLRLVPGTSAVNGLGPIAWRFGIEVERGLPVDPSSFAAAVERILFDERGWLGAGSRITLQRVDEPPFDFMVTLAKPRTVDRLCLPLHTASRVSCENRGRSVINWLRWSTGSPYWGDRARYRHYLINHEVGHALGHGHRFCGGRGQVAPVMQQQTGSAAPCTHAQWPKRFERARSRQP